jgi:chlorite dismutase
MDKERRFLTHYGLYKFNQKFWDLSAHHREQVLHNFVSTMETGSEKTWFYQVYPAQYKFDILIWSNSYADELTDIDTFFLNQGTLLSRFREYVECPYNMWGITKPSQYSRAKKSAQELDPFTDTRKPYFVIYPFTKTSEWYQKSREERQEMMNGHIVTGKKFPEISQLLIYSIGMQDQEFVVAYEQEDLAMFSDLVYELRMTVARIYTLNDTPQITSIFRTKEQLVGIFSGK